MCLVHVWGGLVGKCSLCLMHVRGGLVGRCAVCLVHVLELIGG